MVNNRLSFVTEMWLRVRLSITQALHWLAGSTTDPCPVPYLISCIRKNLNTTLNFNIFGLQNLVQIMLFLYMTSIWSVLSDNFSNISQSISPQTLDGSCFPLNRPFKWFSDFLRNVTGQRAGRITTWNVWPSLLTLSLWAPLFVFQWCTDRE